MTPYRRSVIFSRRSITELTMIAFADTTGLSSDMLPVQHNEVVALDAKASRARKGLLTAYFAVTSK